MSDTIDIATIGEDVPLLEGIRTSSAIRRLKTDPVPLELVRKVCEAGTFAPSGGNRQPWIFIAVTEPEQKQWLAERYRPIFFRYMEPALEAAKDPAFPQAKRKVLEGAVHLAEHIHEAPVHLYVAGWKRRGHAQTQALFPAIQNVLLACRAVGLGASLTTIHTEFGAECDRRLGLPEDCPSCAMLPLGWPAVPYKRPARRSIDECFFVERMPATKQPPPGR